MNNKNKGKEQNVEYNSTYSKSEQLIVKAIMGMVEPGYSRYYYVMDFCEILRQEKDLPFDVILSTCCEAWEINEENILQKIIPSDPVNSVRIYSFFWACQLFNNSVNHREAWAFFGHKIYSSDWAQDKIIRVLQNNNCGHGKIIVQIFAKLSLLCPGRIEAALKGITLADGEVLVKCKMSYGQLSRREANELCPDQKYFARNMAVHKEAGLSYRLRGPKYEYFDYPVDMFDEV